MTTPQQSLRRRQPERTIPDLERENELLHKINEDLSEVLTLLSLQRVKDEQKQLRDMIGRLLARVERLETEAMQNKEALEKARRAFSKLQEQQCQTQAPKPSPESAVPARSTESNRGRSAANKPATTTATPPAPATGSASPTTGRTGASR